MSTGAGLPVLKKSALLERLTQGRDAGCAVVTPNARLSAELTHEFDSRQAARGLDYWDAADILPFSAFVERLYEDALYSELVARLPILLSAAQEQALWEEVIASSAAGNALLSVPATAESARKAWQIANDWKLAARLKGYPANDDARAFADWAWRYAGISERDRHTDRARLPEVVAAHLAHAALKKPRTLVAYGFDILTRQQADFLEALAAAGVERFACGPQPRAAAARRVAFTSAKDEWLAAARWARARLEADPGARIGIILPDVAQSPDAVRHALARVLAPAYLLPGGAKMLPFNLWLDRRLDSYPIVVAAFLVLEIARGEIDFLRASRLIRSPFVGEAEAEMAKRARLDAELRRVSGARVELGGLRRAIAKLTASGNRYGVPACPALSRRLGDLARKARDDLSGAKRPAQWAKVISALLDALGFPGERGLDSAEYQTLKKFHEAIVAFAALDRVAGRMRFQDACARLRRIAAATPFQPEAPEAPIQVLGILEAAGMEFDHLWVAGLTDEAWPMPARPNPFIPVALQRAAGVHRASAALSLELDCRLTQGWLAAAGEVVLSHPLREGDRELVASPLIRGVREAPPEALALPACDSLRDAIRRARREERAPDALAPALAAGAASSGGTAVFADQAACPFRAFARHRLDAKGLETPPPGLDLRDRGTLVHEMLKRIWTDLKSKARLDAAAARDLEALLAVAADAAISRLRFFRPDAIEGRFAGLEKDRLVELGRAWLDLEKTRPEFAVAALEKKHAVSFGGVTVNAKLDRMDRLASTGAGGAHAILDYKTGKASVGGWLGTRPDEPQLPLYASAGGEDIAALAFARVKAGAMEFKGIGREDDLLPGVKTIAAQRSPAARQYGSWEQLRAGWRRELEALGREFAAGEARVDPKDKRNLATCRTCDVKPFCRIYERYGAGFADDAGPE